MMMIVEMIVKLFILARVLPAIVAAPSFLEKLSLHAVELRLVLRVFPYFSFLGVFIEAGINPVLFLTPRVFRPDNTE